VANTLTNLIPVLYQGMDIVARELVGYIPAVSLDAKADSAAVGQTITTSITPPATGGDVTPGQLPPDDGDQTLSTLSMSITKSKYSPIRWTGEELKGFLNAGSPESRAAAQDALAKQFAQSVRYLANLVEADVAAAAYGGASRAYGTAGTTPFGTAADLSDLAQTRKILEDNGAPCSDLQLILSTASAANLRGKQSVLFKVSESGTDTLLRNGAIGNLEGFQVGVSAQNKLFTKGTGSGYVTSGATAQGVNAIALTTGSGTVLSGDVVTFAADSVNKYVVNVGVAAPGTIYIGTPGAQVAIPSGNAMTIGNSYTPNMAFERDAIRLLTRTPAMPEGGDSADDVYLIQDPVSGLWFQVALYRLYRRIKYEVGIAWGVKAVKSDFIATLLG
jgi:hypothetical protein